jgi:hypothetical protein
LAISGWAAHLPPIAADSPAREPQLASQGSRVVLAFGAGDAIYFSASADSGQTFTRPKLVAGGGVLPLNRHRGPHIALSGNSIVITAVVGQTLASGPHAHGLPSDGDLLAWRSADNGKTWNGPVIVNDVAAAPTEGLHSLSANEKGELLAAWLDHRGNGKTKLYAARSADGGLHWSRNFMLYESPDGTICECCAPTVIAAVNGKWAVMFRNVLNGSRDMYLTEVSDSVAGPARKLGEDTWKLNACPMDGGGLAIHKGEVYSAWRRDHDVFLTRAGQPEQRLGSGSDVAIAANKESVYVAWVQAGKVEVVAKGGTPLVLGEHGANVSLVALASGALAAWESNSGLQIERLP